jgi:hypothetical protein
MLSAIQSALNGMTRCEQGIQTCAQNIAAWGADAAQALDSAEMPLPEADLASELIQMKVYKLAEEANARVASTVNDMLGELIDTLA